MVVVFVFVIEVIVVVLVVVIVVDCKVGSFTADFVIVKQCLVVLYIYFTAFKHLIFLKASCYLHIYGWNLLCGCFSIVCLFVTSECKQRRTGTVVQSTIILQYCESREPNCGSTTFI